MKRKPPNDRKGITHKVKIGSMSMHITVNRDEDGEIIEIFGKAGEGMQGHFDMCCRLASLGIQGRADVKTLIRHMRGDRTFPNGIAGQPTSIYDAIARVLEQEQETGEGAP